MRRSWFERIERINDGRFGSLRGIQPRQGSEGQSSKSGTGPQEKFAARTLAPTDKHERRVTWGELARQSFVPSDIKALRGAPHPGRSNVKFDQKFSSCISDTFLIIWLVYAHLDHCIVAFSLPRRRWLLSGRASS